MYMVFITSNFKKLHLVTVGEVEAYFFQNLVDVFMIRGVQISFRTRVSLLDNTHVLLALCPKISTMD
jgi:hypothetical protein